MATLVADKRGSVQVSGVRDQQPCGKPVGWKEALLRPGHASLYESMVAELAEYLEESPALVAAACKAGAEGVAKDWERHHLHKGSPAASVVEFYRTTDSYLFDLTTFNAEYPYTETLSTLVALAKERGLSKVLDFGSGIGSVGLFFAANGMDVTLADVSEPLREYAAWRFKVRGLKVRLINLNSEPLPADSFDVVTAFDVFEHLPEPASALRSIAASMKIGGLGFFNVTRFDANYPQHIASYEEVLSSVSATGFRRLWFLGGLEVFERVERNALSRAWYACWGKLWYRFLYRRAIAVLEFLKIKSIVRKWIKG